jgi:outer membrane biosynthesis protein TonB
MIRVEPFMQAVRALAGLALGASLVSEAPGAAAPLRLSLAPAVAAMAAQAERRAEIAVRFDADGRIVEVVVLRSTGSRTGDAAAREEALQLAGLQAPPAVAGRTLVFRIAFGAHRAG